MRMFSLRNLYFKLLKRPHKPATAALGLMSMLQMLLQTLRPDAAVEAAIKGNSDTNCYQAHSRIYEGYPWIYVYIYIIYNQIIYTFHIYIYTYTVHVYKGYHRMVKHEPALFRIQRSVEAEKMKLRNEPDLPGANSRGLQDFAAVSQDAHLRLRSTGYELGCYLMLPIHDIRYQIYSHMLPINFPEWCVGLSISWFVSSVGLNRMWAKTLYSNYNL